MKKIISLTLVLIMLLSSVLFAFANSTDDTRLEFLIDRLKKVIKNY